MNAPASVPDHQKYRYYCKLHFVKNVNESADSVLRFLDMTTPFYGFWRRLSLTRLVPPGVAQAVLLSTIGTFFGVAPLRADIVEIVSQVGTDVVGSYSGSLVVSSLTFQGYSQHAQSEVNPSTGTLLAANSLSTCCDIYSGLAGPTSFGTGNNTDSSSQGAFGILGSLGELALPSAYIGTEVLNGTITFANTTIADLGLTPGTYVWHFGTGDHRQSVELEIDAPAAVPEPTSVFLFATVVAASVLVIKRKRRAGLGSETAR